MASDSMINQLAPRNAPLSRRDVFAGLAFAGLLAHHGEKAAVATLADMAVAHADQLLAALDAAEADAASEATP